MESILAILESQTQKPNFSPQENVVYQAFLFGISSWLFECADHKAVMPTTIEELIASCDPFFQKYLTPTLKANLTTLFTAIEKAQASIQPSEFLSETYPLIYEEEYDIFQELEQSDTLTEEFKANLEAKFASVKTQIPTLTPVLPITQQPRNRHKKTRRLTGHRAITPIKRNGRRAKTMKHHE
jgi:hypothetical protein